MKVALIGAGKMSKAIVPLAEQRGHNITAVLGSSDNRDGKGIDVVRLGNPDVAIEFTEPGSAVANAMACVRAGVPVVVGTTGWYDKVGDVATEVRRADGALFWAPNFSIGIAMLSIIVDAGMGAVKRFGNYDVHITETHHAAKKDRPSGTAAALAELASRELGRDVPITSVRVGSVPGTHEVVIDGAFDQIRLVHETRDRRVFAEGALSAAEWLVGRRGIFTMKDMLFSEAKAQP
jgi:4-hydroxy-tetrahydrodipicolinate reductase